MIKHTYIHDTSIYILHQPFVILFFHSNSVYVVKSETSDEKHFIVYTNYIRKKGYNRMYSMFGYFQACSGQDKHTSL